MNFQVFCSGVLALFQVVEGLEGLGLLADMDFCGLRFRLAPLNTNMIAHIGPVSESSVCCRASTCFFWV